MSRPSKVIVLVEDERHRQLVRKYLQQLTYSEHDLRFEPLPSGRGCGEQWVRNRYEKAVAAHRARSARVKPALVVAIDADKGDMNRPLKQLEQAPINARLRPPAIDERIVRLIPERNIETRIRVLNGKDGDEHADYSQWRSRGSKSGTRQSLFISDAAERSLCLSAAYHIGRDLRSTEA